MVPAQHTYRDLQGRHAQRQCLALAKPSTVRLPAGAEQQPLHNPCTSLVLLSTSHTARPGFGQRLKQSLHVSSLPQFDCLLFGTLYSTAPEILLCMVSQAWAETKLLNASALSNTARHQTLHTVVQSEVKHMQTRCGTAFGQRRDKKGKWVTLGTIFAVSTQVRDLLRQVPLTAVHATAAAAAIIWSETANAGHSAGCPDNYPFKARRTSFWSCSTSQERVATSADNACFRARAARKDCTCFSASAFAARSALACSRICDARWPFRHINRPDSLRSAEHAS